MSTHTIDKKITDQLNKSIKTYIRAFEKKQEMKFEFWISDEIGGTASFGDEYVFDFQDIRLDLETNQDKGVILEWRQYLIDLGDWDFAPNYKSWLLATNRIEYIHPDYEAKADFRVRKKTIKIK